MSNGETLPADQMKFQFSFQLLKPDETWDLLPYFWFAFHWLAMSHSCYNPIIYCYMNARFRGGFIQILHRIPGLRRSCCIRRCARNRGNSVGTGVALTGEMNDIYDDGGLRRKTRIRIRCHILNNTLQMQFDTVYILIWINNHSTQHNFLF